ncbi:glutamyl-tRNA reductase 1, chloroplastic [Tanacetum coccineum]
MGKGGEGGVWIKRGHIQPIKTHRNPLNNILLYYFILLKLILLLIPSLLSGLVWLIHLIMAVVSRAFAGAKLETLITFNATATASPSSSTTSSCHFPRRTPTTQTCSSSVVRCQSSSNATDPLASNASSISALEQLKTSAADSILLKKSAFQWLEQATLAFKELEQAMVQSPVLALPNFEEEFIIKTNASGYEVGAILQQRGHPIAYLISAAGTKVTTVGVESLRPDWYNKVTTAERIKTAQEKIKIAYVIYVGVYSASSLVGKGQPHIVHGKPEQGGSVAPLLARDTKTESEDLLHKEVVKIRNVGETRKSSRRISSQVGAAWVALKSAPVGLLWKWSVCCGGSAEKLIRQLGVSSGSVPFDMGIKVRLVDSRMWCVMSAGFKTDDGKECGVRMLLHQKKKRQKASSKLVVVRSEKTRNVLLVWNERDMRLQNGPAWSKRPQLPLKKNDENTTTTTLATSKLVGLAKKLPATQYNISLTLSLQEMMFRLRGGYFARENKIGKSPEEVAAREK